MRALVLGMVAAAILGGCGTGAEEEAGAPPEAGGEGVAAAGTTPAAATASADAAGRQAGGEEAVRLGDGFVVWESNRSGDWRIWTAELDGSNPRQLTPDEGRLEHCCPHVSPDGRWVAYLRHEGGGPRYTRQGSSGPLHIIRPDGSGERRVVERARTYGQHRAVVWRSPTELIHITGEGRTALLDLATGESTPLTREGREEDGWLIDATLSWAIDGRPRFSPYQREERRVVERSRLAGCEAYFSHDGRWGYWVSGAGGPIDRIDLKSREITTLLAKNDPRLPSGQGYMYFPMSSRDGRLFAFAASDGDHSHFTADYDVFVVETDPRTLEPLGRAVRITDHPAVDRYPDVFLAPLPLGRHLGEAPFTLRLEAPGDGWSWSFGDGATAEGGEVEHTWSRAGRYEVEARRGGERRAGLVAVSPAAPPVAGEAVLRDGGRSLLVRFDEPVEPASPAVDLAPGPAIVGRELEDDGRTLRLDLAEPLTRFARLTISGYRDRAQRPNAMAPTELEVEPPLWPARRDGLALLFATGDAPNLLPAADGVDRATTVEARGRARLDHAHRLVTDGGSFRVDGETAKRVRAACQATNELSVELTVTPDPRGGANGALLSFADQRRQNFRLLVRDGRLLYTAKIGPRGPEANPEVELFELPPGRATHVVVTVAPGRLTAYRDGERVVESGGVRGDFFQWRNLPLELGPGFAGTMEGIAVWDRVLPAGEAAENHLRARRRLERRPEVPRAVVEAVLVERSPTPTLEEISPYREALAMLAWRVERVVEGDAPERLRAAHWAILDGEVQPVDGWSPGRRARLVLEPFAAQGQLEAVYVSEELAGGGGEGAVFYAVEVGGQ